MMNTVQKHLFIKGRVQGVGFRYYTRKTAEELGIGGWVRNRRDGSVEAVLEGSRGRVEEMIERMKQGPAGSKVREVEINELPADSGHHSSFQVKYTV